MGARHKDVFQEQSGESNIERSPACWRKERSWMKRGKREESRSRKEINELKAPKKSGGGKGKQSGPAQAEPPGGRRESPDDGSGIRGKMT